MINFNLNRNVPHIKQFVILEGELVVISRISDKIYLSNTSKALPIKNEADFVYRLTNNYVLFRLLDGIGVIVDSKLENIRYLTDFNSHFAHKNFIVISKGDLFNQTYGIYSLSENRILFESSEYLGQYIFEDTIYGNFQQIIFCRDITTGKKLWEFDLSIKQDYTSASKTDTKPQKVELRKILGVYHNLVWMILSNGYLLGIEIFTGLEQHYLGAAANNTQENSYVEKYNHAYLFQGYKLDVEKGKIILVNDTHYFEVDLNTETPKKIWADLTSEMNKYGLRCQMPGVSNDFQFDDKYFYFFDGMKAKLGVLNRTNLKIVWTYQMDIQTEDSFVLALLRDLKISTNKLYVHDRNHTLHIFEKV